MTSITDLAEVTPIKQDLGFNHSPSCKRLPSPVNLQCYVAPSLLVHVVSLDTIPKPIESMSA